MEIHLILSLTNDASIYLSKITTFPSCNAGKIMFSYLNDKSNKWARHESYPDKKTRHCVEFICCQIQF